MVATVFSRDLSRCARAVQDEVTRTCWIEYDTPQGLRRIPMPSCDAALVEADIAAEVGAWVPVRGR